MDRQATQHKERARFKLLARGVRTTFYPTSQQRIWIKLSLCPGLSAQGLNVASRPPRLQWLTGYEATSACGAVPADMVWVQWSKNEMSSDAGVALAQDGRGSGALSRSAKQSSGLWCGRRLCGRLCPWSTLSVIEAVVDCVRGRFCLWSRLWSKLWSRLWSKREPIEAGVEAGVEGTNPHGGGFRVASHTHPPPPRPIPSRDSSTFSSTRAFTTHPTTVRLLTQSTNKSINQQVSNTRPFSALLCQPMAARAPAPIIGVTSQHAQASPGDRVSRLFQLPHGKRGGGNSIQLHLAHCYWSTGNVKKL